MSLAPPASSSRDVAYGDIKSWILMGEIPVGMRLVEARIAARLQMSRTPVREALLRLFAERFLERDSSGGYRVNHLTTRTTRELYGVRKALELFALRSTVAARTDASLAALAQLRAEWREVRPEAPDSDPNFVILDEDFHERLAGAAGNIELVEALRRACERIRPVRTHDFVRPGRIEVTIAEHLEILDAAIGGGDAVQLLERHIAESQRLAEAGVGRALERMLTTSEGQLGW